MAEKGAKAQLYDYAYRLYATDGKSLTEIAVITGVSRQTLSEWKAQSQVPGEAVDGWDKARQQKRSSAQRLRALFDRELQALEDAPAGSLSPGTLDAVTKLGTLVQRADSIEQGQTFDRPKVFLENLRFIVGWLRDHDSEGLQVLADSFDAITLAFKEDCLNGNA